MKLFILLFAALPALAIAQDLPPVLHPDQLTAIHAAPGVTLWELSGRTAPAGAPK